jgi:hypothetical protein
MTSIASGGGPIHVTPASISEVGVLGEESVTGMDAIGTGLADRGEDCIRVQVALGRGLSAERVRLVRVTNVQRVSIEFGVHRDGGDAEFPAGPHDSHRDLAAVRDQDLRQQLGLRDSSVRCSDSAAGATRANGSVSYG